MYDKVKIWLSRYGDNLPRSLEGYLDNTREMIDTTTGEIIGCRGKIDNLSIALFRGGMSINGSISKYFLGDNIQTLSRRDTKRAIEKLSDRLHLDISEGKPTELEFGANLMLANPIHEYLIRLGEMPRLVRNTFAPSSIYYQYKGKNKPKEFAFYDKIADAEAKGMDIPTGFAEANLLRYEMRLSHRIGGQTGFAGITIATLHDRQFYSKMLKTWGDKYFSIRKHQLSNSYCMENIKSVGDAIETLLATLLASDPDRATLFVDELKESKVFADPKYYTRLKKKLQTIAEKADCEKDSLLRELDDEIKTIVTNS